MGSEPSLFLGHWAPSGGGGGASGPDMGPADAAHLNQITTPEPG